MAGVEFSPSFSVAGKFVVPLQVLLTFWYYCEGIISGLKPYPDAISWENLRYGRRVTGEDF